jgi:hypothetical protein
LLFCSTESSIVSPGSVKTKDVAAAHPGYSR